MEEWPIKKNDWSTREGIRRAYRTLRIQSMHPRLQNIPEGSKVWYAAGDDRIATGDRDGSSTFEYSRPDLPPRDAWAYRVPQGSQLSAVDRRMGVADVGMIPEERDEDGRFPNPTVPMDGALVVGSQEMRNVRSAPQAMQFPSSSRVRNERVYKENRWVDKRLVDSQRIDNRRDYLESRGLWLVSHGPQLPPHMSLSIRPHWETKDSDALVDKVISYDDYEDEARDQAPDRYDYDNKDDYRDAKYTHKRDSEELFRYQAKNLVMDLNSHVNHVLESRRYRDVNGGGPLWRQDVSKPVSSPILVRDREAEARNSPSRPLYRYIDSDRYATHEEYADALSGVATKIQDYLDSISPRDPLHAQVSHVFNSMGNKLDQAVGILRDAHRDEMKPRRRGTRGVELADNDDTYIRPSLTDRSIDPRPAVMDKFQVQPDDEAAANPGAWNERYDWDSEDGVDFRDGNPLATINKSWSNIIKAYDSADELPVAPAKAGFSTAGMTDKRFAAWALPGAMAFNMKTPTSAGTAIHEMAHVLGDLGGQRSPHLSAMREPLRSLHPAYLYLAGHYDAGLEEGYADAVSAHFSPGSRVSGYPKRARKALRATQEAFNANDPSRSPQLLCPSPGCGRNLMATTRVDFLPRSPGYAEHKKHIDSSSEEHKQHINDALWAYGYLHGAGTMQNPDGSPDDETKALFPSQEDIHGLPSSEDPHPNPFDRIRSLNLASSTSGVDAFYPETEEWLDNLKTLRSPQFEKIAKPRK